MDEGKYQIHNDGPVWGQNVGDHLQIEQTFYLPGSLPAYPAPPEHIWTVPYHRNPFFTGRETLLQRLHNNLVSSQATALTQPQAINGLGGIGKTQVALEYAYRRRQEYRYVFWVRAATLDTLTADFVSLARSLRLPEQNEQDQNLVVDAVKRWLTEQSGWLLILDNADDLDPVYGFLPTRCTGHILLTTREQVVSKFSQSVEVDNLDIEEGTLMLLRRAGLLAPNALLDQTALEDKEHARAIVQEMGGLPLALDQAGAYIEETRCTLSEYLEVYQHKQADLLKRRGRQHQEYPDSVATTWSLSLEKVEQTNPIAAELLRCAAFLAPDDIPEALLLKGATQLGPILKLIARQPSLLKEAIGELRRFSLVRYHPAGKLFSIHRLVQATLKTTMDKKAQRVWAKRVIQAVNQSFPPIGHITLSQSQQYLPHALECATLIDVWDIKSPDAAQLLSRTGLYLYNRARYAEAEPHLQHALNICERTRGTNPLGVARSLRDLADLYGSQFKTAQQAEPLYQRALAMYEKNLGPEHPDTLSCLIDLAQLYENLRKSKQAEQCYQRVLATYEKVHGPETPEVVNTLISLAELFKTRYRRATKDDERKKT